MATTEHQPKVRVSVIVAQPVADELAKVAEQRGILFSRLVENLILEGLERLKTEA